MDNFNRKKNESPVEEKESGDYGERSKGLLDNITHKAEVDRIAEHCMHTFLPEMKDLPPYDEVVRTHLLSTYEEAKLRGLHFSSYMMILTNHTLASFVGGMANMIRSTIEEGGEGKELFKDFSPLEISYSIVRQQLANIAEGLRMEAGEIEVTSTYRQAMEEAAKYHKAQKSSTNH